MKRLALGALGLSALSSALLGACSSAAGVTDGRQAAAIVVPGEASPTPVASPTPLPPSPTQLPVLAPTATALPTFVPTVSATPTQQPTATPAPTLTPTLTPVATVTPPPTPPPTSPATATPVPSTATAVATSPAPTAGPAAGGNGSGGADPTPTLTPVPTITPPPTADPSTPTPGPSPTPIPLVVVDQPPVQFASISGVALVLPAQRIQRIGYHQAGHTGSQQMAPVESGVRYSEMGDRSRGTGLRSAADIVVDPGVPIVAPVTGRVFAATNYVLYCQYTDDLIYIEPDGLPGWELKIFHVDGLRVAIGDRVVAGQTIIADRARQLPFESQVDAMTAKPAWPHVHIEVVDPSIPDERPAGGGCS